MIFDTKIKIFKSSVKVKSINSFVYDSFEYVFMNFYVSDHIKFEEKAVTHFIRELHIVEKLKVKMLMSFPMSREIITLFSFLYRVFPSSSPKGAHYCYTLENGYNVRHSCSI